MDRMRESIFAYLVSLFGHGDLSGLSFLDLFAGSGVIALEAVSRGAKPVDLVEKDRSKIGVLLKNAALVSRESLTCHFMAAELFLRNSKSKWDIIFCDPPFPYRFHAALMESIAAGELLTPSGRALIHRPAEKPLPEQVGALARLDQKVYGRSVVDVYGY
jgi:16S rRNA (guanine(966)-N(2))-methyltransferase RsmD